MNEKKKGGPTRERDLLDPPGIFILRKGNRKMTDFSNYTYPYLSIEDPIRRRNLCRAYERAECRAVEQCRFQQIMEMARSGNFDDCKPLHEFKDQFKLKKDTVTENQYLITVNPKPEVSLPLLVKQVDKYVSRKTCTAVEWAYEQRGEDESQMGKGHHVHLIVQKPEKMRNKYFQDQTRATFEKLVGNPETHVSIKPFKIEELSKIRGYLQDIKADEKKHLKQEFDKPWRVINNLKEYYETTTKIQCLAQPISTELESEKDDKL